MRPLTVLLGIAMGSSAALLAGLTMTLVVFLMLPEYADRLGTERLPLLVAVGWSLLLTVASSAAFIGELRHRSWRYPAMLGLLVAFCGILWTYWPAGRE